RMAARASIQPRRRSASTMKKFSVSLASSSADPAARTLARFSGFLRGRWRQGAGFWGIQMSQRNKKQISKGLTFLCAAFAPALLFVMALFASADRASAQGFPARTVKIIVPFQAGGSADVLPR